MTLASKRKNRPGGLPFLRSYPKNQNVSDLTSILTPLVPNEDADDINMYWRYRARLAPREGGRNNDVTGGGLTDRGLSQKYLNILRLKPEWTKLPAQPDQVSDRQLNGIYCWDFYVRPQVDQLAQIPGLAEKAPKLAELIFDSAVQHGDIDAGKWLQTALNRHVGTDLPVDGVMGSRTRQAVEQALASNKIAQVNNSIVTQRLAHMTEQHNFHENSDNWISRAMSFLTPWR